MAVHKIPIWYQYSYKFYYIQVLLWYTEAIILLQTICVAPIVTPAFLEPRTDGNKYLKIAQDIEMNVF